MRTRLMMTCAFPTAIFSFRLEMDESSGAGFLNQGQILQKAGVFIAHGKNDHLVQWQSLTAKNGH